MVRHRKRTKHFHEPGHFHEFTSSCYQRRQLLTEEQRLRLLSTKIESACVEAKFHLVACVFMPEHVHLLTFPTQPKPDLGRFLSRVKQPFSRQVKAWLTEQQHPLLRELTIRERPGKFCFRFWQAGAGYDRNIYSPEVLEASIDYIHNNPVKRGLCEKAIDWPWSSARYYLLDPPKQQFAGLPRIHGIPAGAFDKDQRNS